MSKKLIRESLLATTVIAGMVFASPAYAQDVTTTGEATEAQVRDIVVTGTRIVSPNIVSLQPIQVVSEAEIDESGAINIQEVLVQNPAVAASATRTNTAFGTSGGGAVTVALRDLGSDRTLVLINSRRVVAGFPGTATVDLNVIPTQFIERIDILTGGASSLYGSDAVAGVINFIYKKNFEGVSLEGQYGLTQRGDSARYQLGATAGGNFADDRGNLMVHIGYTNEKGLLSRQRKNTLLDDFDYFYFYGGPPEKYGTPVEPFFSSFVPQGRFDVNGTGTSSDDFTFDPATGALLPCFRANSTGPCGGTVPQGFNRQYFRTLAVPIERYLFATRGTFEVSNQINFIAEGTYAKTSSARDIEPFPLSSDDIFPVDGRAPIETFVDGVPVLNPFVPAAIAAAATDRNGDGLKDIAFARRLAEVGLRSASNTRDFFRIVTGFEGKLFNDRFSWDMTYNYGQTTESQDSNGQVNVLNFRNALAVVPDVNDANNNGSISDFVCADVNAVKQGCAPLNIFGIGSISPEALKYINAEGSYRTKISQKVWAANISGAIVELPAGPLGVALGAEYRQEQSEADWDALTNAGLNAGNALPDTKGKFSVKELYGEVNIPVMRDQPFFHQLNLRAAGRLSDYSTVGSVKTYSLGADWAPVQALRFRGTYAKAVRAPNIAELFTGPSQTFPSGLADPCEDVTPADTDPVALRCLAAPGIPLNIAENGGVFTLSQADQQGISGFDSGTSTLNAERARSITFGVVFAPRNIPALRNLVLSADYYNILVKDAIINPARQTILNQCYVEGVDEFCDLVIRRPINTGSNSAGSLEFINSPAINGAELKAEGLDFVGQYRTSLDRVMAGWNMSVRAAWTHLLDGYVIEVPGVAENRIAGEIGTPKDRVSGSLALNSGKVGISVGATYIGKSFEDDQYLESYGYDDEVISVGDEYYFDTQITFTPTRQYEFYLGVDNVLDNKAPKILNGSPFNSTGTDTSAGTYDIFGRRFYAGVRLRL